MRSYKTEGIIIKRRNFAEADRILTVLTKTYGKIQVRAPGVRKITSRRSSHIELLNLTLFALYKNSHSSLPIVTEAEAQEDFLSIKKTLKKIGIAYYICELIDSLCAQNQENRKAFFLVRDTLFQLAGFKANAVQESFSRHSGHSILSSWSKDLSRISLNHGDSGCASSTLVKSREAGSRSARQANSAFGLRSRMTDGEGKFSIVSNFETELLVTLGFLPNQHKLADRRAFIESILEKKLRTRRLLPLFLSNSEG